jgi:hypothetical protein
MQIRGDTGGVWGCYFSFEGVRTERGVSSRYVNIFCNPECIFFIVCSFST